LSRLFITALIACSACVFEPPALPEGGVSCLVDADCPEGQEGAENVSLCFRPETVLADRPFLKVDRGATLVPDIASVFADGTYALFLSGPPRGPRDNAVGVIRRKRRPSARRARSGDRALRRLRCLRGGNLCARMQEHGSLDLAVAAAVENSPVDASDRDTVTTLDFDDVELVVGFSEPSPQ